ncbi:MAG: alkaline phosphatase family protein, partial [Vicinamibacterales bacterium]|nr:alkaline phosphatase family protein [Vicinamibacterales bacterium]
MSVIVALAVTVACNTPATPQYSQRLVILGFDGLDPDLVEQFIADGKLPHLASLVGDSGVHRLETTVSSESEPAWASFATGLSPAGHGLFDARVRDPASYATRPGLVERDPARFLLNYLPMRAPAVRSTRAGTPFWVTAGRAGVRSAILSVPGTFPADVVTGTEILASVPALDPVMATGAYTYYASDLAEADAGPTPFGGLAARLVLTGDVAPADLVGPPDPVIADELGALRARTELTEQERLRLEELSVVEHLRIPMTVRWNRGAPDPRTVTIEFEDQSLHLRQGEWSRWVDVEFRANLLVRFRAMTQILLVDASDTLRLYVSPLQWHPVAPPLPISSPPELSAELYDRLGAYRTLGWAEATAALQEDRIDERAFLDDLDRAFDDRAELILSRLDRPDWNLLVGVVEAPDRVQHMMWRLIDPRHPRFDADLAARYGLTIEQIYRRSDDLV